MVVERGVAMQNMMQERRLAEGGQLRGGSNMGQGQMVTPDFVLTPDVVFSRKDAGGVGGALGSVGSLFGAGGAVLGAVAGGVKLKQAQTSMLVADTRTGVQVAAASGSAEKADWGVGGLLAGGGAAGALGAYENTAEGKVVAASFLDNYNQVERSVRGNPSLQRMASTLRQEAATQPRACSAYDKGEILVPKISGVRLRAQPGESSKVVGTLTKIDEVISLGAEKDGFLSVRGSKGSGWVETMMLRP
ncbi:MAG TPA: SH3 domain-containing protein, partial [Burkholderiales bacterium]